MKRRNFIKGLAVFGAAVSSVPLLLAEHTPLHYFNMGIFIPMGGPAKPIWPDYRKWIIGGVDPLGAMEHKPIFHIHYLTHVDHGGGKYQVIREMWAMSEANFRDQDNLNNVSKDAFKRLTRQVDLAIESPSLDIGRIVLVT